MMMTKLKEAALAMALTVSSQEALADRPDFQLPVERGDKSKVVNVHCDRLNENGEITPEFVKAMGIESHFSYIDYKIDAYEQKTGNEVSDEKRAQLYLDHHPFSIILTFLLSRYMLRYNITFNEWKKKNGGHP